MVNEEKLQEFIDGIEFESMSRFGNEYKATLAGGVTLCFYSIANNWFVSCEFVNINGVDLQTDDFNIAKRRAVLLIIKPMQDKIKELVAFVSAQIPLFIDWLVDALPPLIAVISEQVQAEIVQKSKERGYYVLLSEDFGYFVDFVSSGIVSSIVWIDKGNKARRYITKEAAEETAAKIINEYETICNVIEWK